MNDEHQQTRHNQVWVTAEYHNEVVAELNERLIQSTRDTEQKLCEMMEAVRQKQQQLADAEKTLNSLGYEKHGIGWAIVVDESPPSRDTGCQPVQSSGRRRLTTIGYGPPPPSGLTITETTTEMDRVAGARRITVTHCTRDKSTTITMLIEQAENLCHAGDRFIAEPVEHYQAIPDDLTKNLDLARYLIALADRCLHLPGLMRIQ